MSSGIEGERRDREARNRDARTGKLRLNTRRRLRAKRDADALEFEARVSRQRGRQRTARRRDR